MNKKERIAAYQKTYQETNKEKLKAYNKVYNKTHRKEKTAYNKKYQLQKRYGITLEEKRTMYKQQNRRCAICSKELIESMDCHVDHCHVTGKVRGLLCRKCNTMLGNVNDDLVILRGAVDYLLRWENSSENKE